MTLPIFKYERLADGYKMIGNAVPVELSFACAKVPRLFDEHQSKKP